MRYFNINDFILGVDEVGRGPYAGCCVVCGVVLGGYKNSSLADSKSLSKKVINVLAYELIHHAKQIYIEVVSVKQIDEFGIKNAVKQAMTNIINNAKYPINCIDFERIDSNLFTISLKKGDVLIPSISAASIVAKHYRDSLMQKLDQYFPEYDFANNVGYGTKKHQAALEKYGYIPNIHRRSFKPVAQIERVYEKC